MSGGKGMRCVVYMGGVYMGLCVHEERMRV